ncbi:MULTISPECIES: DUF1192 domain-containing protein [unclassified Chelatococcus]|uniref:DUF1192 domain-containing protein n=1 Tax=unclassified Chelatococcus TaxID=2638111 RepID=UPI001BCDBA09|nr:MULTISPECIES: DUF1192 domain-containing protein [unclassified Chelatococcus]MBS7696610.1 DUF1192 domain-containing protein [Chelatococcus sp. YT9]MBX3555175.1 DUF1192 domain-containing protein [Chelatococcus sp.]
MVGLFDDEAPRPVTQHVLGQDLSALSLHELTERIALLRAEIERLTAARAAKEASRAQADSVFRS